MQYFSVLRSRIIFLNGFAVLADLIYFDGSRSELCKNLDPDPGSESDISYTNTPI
jgi:hypothetical protein